VGTKGSPPEALGTRVKREDNPDEQPAKAARTSIATTRRMLDQTNSLASSGYVMNANATRFDPFNTRLIVRKGRVDSSTIRSTEPKLLIPKPGLPEGFHLAILRHYS